MTRRPDATARSHREPSLQLIPPDPSARLVVDIGHLEPEDHARVTFLVPFVGGFRRMFAVHWPARGVAPHLGRRPFPECWPLHPALVAELAMVERWAAAVEANVVEGTGGPDRGYDAWSRHVMFVTVPMVQEVARGVARSRCLHRLSPGPCPSA